MQQFVFLLFFFLLQDNWAVHWIEIQINPLSNIIVCHSNHTWGPGKEDTRIHWIGLLIKKHKEIIPHVAILKKLQPFYNWRYKGNKQGFWRYRADSIFLRLVLQNWALNFDLMTSKSIELHLILIIMLVTGYLWTSLMSASCHV